MAPKRYITAKELRHGDVVNVTLHSSGRPRLQAVVAVEGDYVYFCQNECNGSKPKSVDIFGYHFTWAQGLGSCASIECSDIELLSRAGDEWLAACTGPIAARGWYTCDSGIKEESILSKDIDLKKIMTSVKTFVKNLTLSADEKLLRKFGLKNDCGEYTSEAREAVFAKIVADNEAYLITIAKGLEAEANPTK